MKQNVTFYTVGGKVINAEMEMADHIAVIEFVDENDYVIVEVNGANQIIPKNKIDYFTVQAVR